MRTKPVSTISFLIVYQPPGYAERIYDLITIAFLVHQKMDIRLRVLCDIARVGTSSTHTIDKIIKQSKRGPNRTHITSYRFSGHKDRQGMWSSPQSSLPTRATTIWNTSGKGMRCANRLSITSWGVPVLVFLPGDLCSWGRHRWRWEYPGDSPKCATCSGTGGGMTKMRGAERHDTIKAGSEQASEQETILSWASRARCQLPAKRNWDD